MEIADIGLVTLHVDISGAYLRHRFTREIQRLPATPDDFGYGLSFSADGFAFVSHQWLDESVWADFKLKVAQGLDDNKLQILDGDVAVTYSEFMRQQKRRHLLLKLGPACLGLVIWIFANSQPGGFRIWWGLGTLWKELKASPLKAHEWISNWWRWWEKRADKMNFCYPDLRPSLRGQKPPASSFLATEVEFDGRVLPEATASTPVFLMIAIRCSCSRSKNRCDQEAQQWRLMLEALFLQYLPLAFQVLMPLRIGMPRLPGEPPAGTHMELMECTRTTINLAGVSHTLLEALPKVVLEELDCNGCIPLWRFVCILDAAGASALNLYSHFLHGIAVVLEAQLLSDTSDSLVVTLPIVAGAPSKIDLGKTAKAMKASRDANIAQMLCKYFYAGRKHFSAEVSYLSLACDATRMGKRSCMIGCVASPGNLFMWSPPQAIRQIRAPNPTTIRTAKLRFGGSVL
jgi:hypothetical protein